MLAYQNNKISAANRSLAPVSQNLDNGACLRHRMKSKAVCFSFLDICRYASSDCTIFARNFVVLLRHEMLDNFLEIQAFSWQLLAFSFQADLKDGLPSLKATS